MTIFYRYGGKLYINITNRCHCNCTFCIRQNGESVGDSDSLWLAHEPSLEEIIDAYEKQDLDGISEVVFCGYGEPLERLDMVLDVCKYLREHTDMKIRVNTNGLCDLIHAKPTAPLLKGLVDEISISLNASTAAEYQRLTRCSFGEVAFEAMLQFARGCKESVPRVVFTVVDVIGPDEVEACHCLADEMGIELRVRQYVGK